MNDGRSEFPLTITAKDIREIADTSRQLRIEDITFIRNATLDEVHAAYILMSLSEFMKTRRVLPGFQVVLSE